MRFVANVRYGAMGFVGEFFSRFSGLRLNDKVIARSDRGVETGNVISQPRPMSADAPDPQGLGEILRKTTPDDAVKVEHIENEIKPQEFKFCEKRLAELKLPMRLAEVEHLFGGTKVIFYFLAEGRVDFRELVRDLAREYHTRIEMRQIGVRDEARLLAFYEHCGRELCCRTFMKNLEPVTMRMAKNQKATLDPTKISGRCGRLMCCLRYEDQTYNELKQSLPRKGTRILTTKGTGEVLSHDVLSQTVKIEISPGKELVVSVDDIQKVLPPESVEGASERGEESAAGPARQGRSNEGPDRTAQRNAENRGACPPQCERNCGRPHRGGPTPERRGEGRRGPAKPQPPQDSES
jgi:cell fate regulator YaaT (PSP1 superfamily)